MERTNTLSYSSFKWLLISIALVTLPHIVHMPIWITIIIVFIATWRWMAEVRHWQLPRKFFRIAITISSTLLVYIGFGTIVGRDAGVTLLVMMVTLKLLEMNQIRDATLILFLCYFLITTNFLYSQSIFLAVYMFLTVVVVTSVMIGIAHSNGNLSLQKKMALSTTILLQSLPIMLVLFILFPRIPGPFWSMPSDNTKSTTGLSDEMTPGTISKLIRSKKVAFRVTFQGETPKPEYLYWRGPVLLDFNGRTWSQRQYGLKQEFSRAKYFGEETRYTVTLEPNQQKWLMALDIPATFNAHGYLTPEYQMLSKTSIKMRTQYTVSSYTNYLINETLSDRQRIQALHLSDTDNPQARQLAQSWKNQGLTPHEIVQEALAYFRDNKFLYTLSPPLLGRHPVDDFLFNTREGFCEHFSSSFAVLMRMAGIPARIVTGYQGGETNPLSDYMIIRQSDAHAWVELWMDKDGWKRIDPTAVIAPERVQGGIDAAIQDPAFSTQFLGMNLSIWHNLELMADSISNNWNQWILGYDDTRQRSFLSSLGIGIQSWFDMIIALAVGITLFLLLIALYLIAKKEVNNQDPIVELYRKFCSKLNRKGLPRLPHEGPMTFAQRVAEHRPDIAAQVNQITELYVDLRYGTGSTEQSKDKLKSMISTFHPKNARAVQQVLTVKNQNSTL